LADIFDEQRLQWIQRNRGPRARGEQTAGQAADKLLQRKLAPAHDRAAEAAALLGEAVDDEFAARCRVAGVFGDSLVIYVDHPDYAYRMRQTWTAPLLALLKRSGRRGREGGGFRGLGRSVFRYGEGGCRIERTVAGED